MDACGSIDELNCALGAAHTSAAKDNLSSLTEKLASLQNQLFDAGAEVATPHGEVYEKMIKVTEQQVTQLEHWIDQLTEALPELKSFVLPGGSQVNAQLHMARAICRRAERDLWRLSRSETLSEDLLKYFNRLSDLLFAMARYSSKAAGIGEFLWVPGK